MTDVDKKLQKQQAIPQAVSLPLPRNGPSASLGQWLQDFYDQTEPLPADFLAERETLQS